MCERSHLDHHYPTHWQFWIMFLLLRWNLVDITGVLNLGRSNGPLTRYLKLPVAYAPGMSETFSPQRLKRRPQVSVPGMHHGTCVTHVPWCIPGSLNRDGGENVPGILGTCAIRNITYLVRGPYTVCYSSRFLSEDWINHHCSIH